MSVAAGNLVDAFVPEPGDLERIRLERIAFAVLWHLDNDVRRITKLSHFAGAPRVEVAALIVVLLIVFLEEFELVRV